MSATNVLSQLMGLLRKTKELQDRFRKVYPTDDQWNSLSQLSLNLAEAVTELGDEIRVLRQSRTQRAWQESEKHRLQAQSTRGDLFARGRLKQPAIFRRNCAVIFEGPKDSSFDSDDTRSRKESTRTRCGIIQSLSPDGIVSWAMAYAPTLWAGGSMSADIFNCLIEDIEPELGQKWPPVIQDTLRKLKDDEEYLQKSPEYNELLGAINNPSHRAASRKRRRIEEEYSRNEPLEAGGSPVDQAGDSVCANNESPAAKNDTESAVQTGRQIQYMYSKAPVSQISLLGSLLSDAVESSRQFQMERRLGELTTDCLTILIPKDPTQDISITLWVGQEAGLRMNDIFMLGPKWSS